MAYRSSASAVLLTTTWGTSMRFGIKGGSIAVLTAAVLATAACGSSGQIGASAGGTSAPGTSAGSTGKTAGTPPNTAIVPNSSAASSGSSGSSASVGGGTGKTLTTDQIRTILLTDKDDAGYTYDASKDDATVTDTQDAITAGGSACQMFVDAENGLSTRYGTTAEVNRVLTKASAGHAIESSVLAMPSPAKALAMTSDVSTSLQGCKTLSATISGSPGSMTLSAIPQLTKPGQAGYLDYMTVGGKTVLMAADLAQVGSAVSVVALIGPVTSDSTSLQQMGATLGHLSDLQVGRLKKVQGLG
ncbi:hypothetical protein ABH926_001997 [Catenulispora sp. GP43]|uniref:sensor domain-containing protein n=1 Tax=Catenulispora sp. GP43 TaxID=3156263 RepID=UPI003516EA2B